MLLYEADGSVFTIGLWQESVGACVRACVRACGRASLAMDSCRAAPTHPLGTRLTISVLLLEAFFPFSLFFFHFEADNCDLHLELNEFQ